MLRIVLVHRQEPAIGRPNAHSLMTWRMPFAVVLLLTGVTLIAVGTQVSVAQGAALRTPIMSFLASYAHNADAMHYTPENLVIPAAWLYSPKGELVSVAQDSKGLDALMKQFPPTSDKVLANQPSLTALSKVLQDANAGAIPGDRDSSRWTIVLFLSNSSACKHCAHFEQVTRDLGRANATSLRTFTVTLTAP